MKRTNKRYVKGKVDKNLFEKRFTELCAKMKIESEKGKRRVKRSGNRKKLQALTH